MTDCVQYKVDTNPCSPTFNTYRLFDVPCPPASPVTTPDTDTRADYVLYVNNVIDEYFVLEIVNQANEKMTISISIQPQDNEIYLKEGTYRLCFYHQSKGNYVLRRIDNNQMIYSNSCRDNLVVNQDYRYTIDYL